MNEMHSYSHISNALSQSQSQPYQRASSAVKVVAHCKKQWLKVEYIHLRSGQTSFVNALTT